MPAEDAERDREVMQELAFAGKKTSAIVICNQTCSIEFSIVKKPQNKHQNRAIHDKAPANNGTLLWVCGISL